MLLQGTFTVSTDLQVQFLDQLY